MKIQEIIQVIKPMEVIGLSAGTTAAEMEINHLLTDSRQLGADAAHTLFFGLHTARRNGSAYVGELYNKGVRAFVVDEEGARNTSNTSKTSRTSKTSETSSSPEDAVILVVESPLDALQALAAHKRSLYHGPVIGITGSNGKTVVKEWLAALLAPEYHVIRSPKSYNSQIGVALSVWGVPEGEGEEGSICIFEAGISKPGEMERLEKMIRPTMGVITYIGAEHGENFASMEEKRAEKMKLFANTPVIIEDKSHQNVRTCAAVMRALGYDEETINSRILSQTHETVMTINLTALTDNVRYFRSLLRPDTRLTCMVKAFAYGAGSMEVSKALQQSNLVNYLAVAVADEGVELRKAGITMPIIVMDPEVAAMDLILENNLEPNVYSFAALETVTAAAEAKGLEYYPIHIKIDSGMHRLGFYREQMPELIGRLQQQRQVRVASVFSHLAGSDEAQFDDFTKGQIACFQSAADELIEAVSGTMVGMPKPMRHILNSAGIERFTPYQMEMCRLGIGLYGFSFAGAKLRNVCTLKTTLLSVKTVGAGETIGYGRHTTLAEDRVIGVIPIGYADGFDRRFSNYGGEVLVRGKRCPIVGNVCMDQAMVDITGTDAMPGDEVEIFGDRLPLEELATRLGTITYEILTSVSRRVKRVYYYE